MPLVNNLNVILGAAVLGVISAAGMYLVEHYRQEKSRHKMAKDLARLDQELSFVKRELDQLLAQKADRLAKREKRSRSNTKKNNRETNSVLSNSTDDYLSASNLDSSDLEFYDVSDDEQNESMPNIDMILGEIDVRLDTGSIPELEKTLQKIKDLCLDYPENPDFLWRLGKAHQKIADHIEDKNKIQQHILQGVEACSEALRLNDNCAEIHKWYAILIGSRSDFVSLQEKISDGHLFKKHVDKALFLNPNDASLHHMLGQFDFEVAGLKWYERKVAAALFTEPPNATYDQALKNFMQAEELANFEWKENRLMIAKCKIALGNYKEAIEWLVSASNCKQGDSLDKIDLEVKGLLEKYNGLR